MTGGRPPVRHPLALLGVVLATAGAVGFLVMAAAAAIGFFTQNPYAGSSSSSRCRRCFSPASL